MDQVRRSSDDELCGHVELRSDRWCALTVFGAVIGEHDRRDDAIDHVLEAGLPVLAERWILRGAGADDEVVCIQEANADSVTLVLGYYALPGVPTLTISVDQLAAGEWELTR